MGNKKLVIAIIIVILLIGGIIGGYFFIQNNNKQSNILHDEMKKLAELDIIKDDVDLEIKTTGDYAAIEETVKNYFKDAKNTYTDAQNYCNDSEISKILSEENIQASKNLEIVKQKTEEYVKKPQEYKIKAENLTTENTIMQEIKSKNLNDYYNDIYKNIMMNDALQEKLKLLQTETLKYIDTDEQKAKGLQNAIEFLENNQKYWELNEGKVSFTNDKKLAEYYELLNSNVK